MAQFCRLAVLVAMLVLYEYTVIVSCRDNGYQQDSAFRMDDCLRSVVPTQIYILCCMRENNCSMSRFQAKAVDCISRVAAANSTLLMMSSSSQSNSQTGSSDRRLDDDILLRATDNCRSQSNSRQPLCIRNELSRYCQNQVSQFRSTASRMYNRRGSVIPSSVWDTGSYADSYPMDSAEYGRRGVYPPDMSYYPRTYMSRRLYGRGGTGSRSYSSYGGGSSSYGDEGDDEMSYGSQSDESYAK